MAGAWELPDKPACDVFIATPSLGGLVTLDWALSQYYLGRGLATMMAEPHSWKGMPVDNARNLLVSDAQEAGARYIWFLDSDVQVPALALQYMITYRVPVISALVYGKQNQGPALWRLNRDGKTYQPVQNFPKPSLQEVDAIPMGCCLIDMRVFDHMEWPYFKWEIQDPRLDRGSGRLSEDFYFCRKAAACNFRLYCYTGIEVGHEETRVYAPDGSVIRNPNIQ